LFRPGHTGAGKEKDMKRIGIAFSGGASPAEIVE
jgi:hypothetical protein